MRFFFLNQLRRCTPLKPQTPPLSVEINNHWHQITETFLQFTAPIKSRIARRTYNNYQYDTKYIYDSAQECVMNLSYLTSHFSRLAWTTYWTTSKGMRRWMVAINSNLDFHNGGDKLQTTGILITAGRLLREGSDDGLPQ